MNQKQYIRLSIVLAVPTLILSFWLAQQDFVFNRGQFVHCSMSNDDCYYEQMPLNKLEEVANNNTLIEYKLYYPDAFLGIYDINFPMKIFLSERYSSEEVEVTNVITSKMLETTSCSLSILTLICEEPLFSWASSYGRIEFINPDENQQYIDRIGEAQSHLKDYFLIRTAIGLGIFLSIAASYLIFSWLVHFIIYGAKIGSQKKRPYQ